MISPHVCAYGVVGHFASFIAKYTSALAQPVDGGSVRASMRATTALGRMTVAGSVTSHSGRQDIVMQQNSALGLVVGPDPAIVLAILLVLVLMLYPRHLRR